MVEVLPFSTTVGSFKGRSFPSLFRGEGRATEPQEPSRDGHDAGAIPTGSSRGGSGGIAELEEAIIHQVEAQH